MKKQLSYYVLKLEEAGIDTSNFYIMTNGIALKPEDVNSELIKDLDKCVSNNYIQTNSDLFRKYGCLCLNWRDQITQNKNHKLEHGFDAFVRNELSYKYQFEFVVDNLIPSNDSFYQIAKRFFTKEVMIAVCEHYISKCEKNDHYNDISFKELYKLISLMGMSKRDEDCYSYFKSFSSNVIGIWVHEYKCSQWKDAFKGLMNYCAIDYLIKDGTISNMTLEDLQSLLDNDDYMEHPYKFYTLLNNLLVPISGEHEKPDYNPNTLETTEKGIYVAGVVNAGRKTSELFIENTRDHGEKIVESIKNK